MILLWLAIGIALAIILARLYKSQKLFWIAFTSFTIGIAAESILFKMNRSKDDLTQVYPTQVVSDTSSYYNAFSSNSLLADVSDTTQSLVPNPVSQEITPERAEVNFTLSKYPTEPLEKPPTDGKN